MSQTEEEETSEDMARRFSLSTLLDPARIRCVGPVLRLYLSFALKEPDWATEHIQHIFVDDSDVLQLVVEASINNIPVQIVRELCPRESLVHSLTKLGEAAELGARDIAWILKLPRVTRQN